MSGIEAYLSYMHKVMYIIAYIATEWPCL